MFDSKKLAKPLASSKTETKAVWNKARIEVKTARMEEIMFWIMPKIEETKDSMEEVRDAIFVDLNLFEFYLGFVVLEN